MQADMREGLIMLENQIALVTGASRGIGRSIAMALASAGATVVGTATTKDGAAAISAYLVAAGTLGSGMVLDVRDGAQVEALIAEIEKLYGSISVLVNNAGITQDNLALRMKESEWDMVIDTNLKSVFRLSKAVLRGMMRARGGRIINITSVVGASGNAGQINYAAAKAGTAGLTRSLAREIGSRAVTGNCGAPGQARGCGRRSPVSRLAGRRICHRSDTARERRHVHDLKRSLSRCEWR